jgi:hypothetical protein
MIALAVTGNRDVSREALHNNGKEQRRVPRKD